MVHGPLVCTVVNTAMKVSALRLLQQQLKSLWKFYSHSPVSFVVTLAVCVEY